MPGLDPVVFLSPSSIGTAIEVTVASLASPTELNSISASQGDLVITRTVAAGTDDCVIYYADTTSDAQSLPYIVSSATSGVKFIAIAGRYRNGEETSASGFTGPHMRALSSAGLLLENSNGDDVALLGAGPGTGTTFYGGVVFSSTLSVIDTNFSIIGSGDATKAIKFEVDAQTANDTLTIDTGAQTDSRTATFPVLTGNSILTLSNATLTSGRVPFATTNGILTDSANLTYSASLLAATNANASSIRLNAATGNFASLSFFESGVAEFTMGKRASGALVINDGGSLAGNDRWSLSTGGAMSLPATAVTHTIASTTDSTSKDTGSIVTEGGIGVEKAVNVGTTLTVGSTSNTAAVTLSGGVSQSVTVTDPGGTTYVNQATLNYALTSNGSQVVGQRHTVSTTNNAFNYTASIGLRAFYLTVNHTGTGTVTGMSAGISEWNVTNTGNVTNAYGHRYTCAVTAASTVTTGRGVYIGAPQISGGGAITTFNGLEIEAITGAGTNRAIYTQGAGLVVISDTTDSTSKDTGSIVTEGGIAGEKNFISAQGIHAGVSSTATAAGTTTLTSASRRTQIFTGTTTQTLQLPAANVFGSGIGVEYIVVNRSTGTVTAQRAGSDTFDGGGTTDAILTNTTRHYVSNGSNQWHTIA